MKLLITGTPGTGKTEVSKLIAKHFVLRVVNEKTFAKKHKIGKLNALEKTLEIDPKALEKKLNAFLAGKKNVLAEGHLLCETRLKVNFAVLLRADAKVLEKRLKKRGYGAVKALDNAFLEEIGYCKKELLKRYRKEKIIEADSSKNIKQTTRKIIKEIEKRLEK